MEIETWIDADGSHHIVVWHDDKIRSHSVYQELSEFEQALLQLSRQYPLAQRIQSILAAA